MEGKYQITHDEIQEAWYYDFHDLDGKLIEESNNVFASIVSRYINERLNVLYKNVIHEYGLLAQSNLIARFNLARLSFNEFKKHSICHTIA